MQLAEPVHIAAHAGWVWKVAWNPTGTRLASCASDGTIKLWQWPGGNELWSARAYSNDVRALAWSLDGTRIASTGDRDRNLKIWEAATGRLSASFDINGFGALALAWSPDEKHLVAGLRNEIIVLDFLNGSRTSGLPGHAEFVREVTWSPDGRRLASVSDDTTVRVWDMESGKGLHTMLGHVNQVKSVAWSPDGTRLATGSWDGTLKIWNSANAQMLCSLAGAGLLHSVAWSPDGKRIASGNLAGEIWIRDSTPGQDAERRR